MATEKHCLSCTHVAATGKLGLGVCRRYPPAHVTTGISWNTRALEDAGHFVVENEALQPEVTANDICGEWKPRDEQT